MLAEKMTLSQAFNNVIRDCKDPYAREYAKAAMQVASAFGTEGLRTQILYVLSNTAHWRGPLAKETKATFKEYLKKTK